MEIIPTINIVLIIVVALTIITLSISYIASKLRHSRSSENLKNNFSDDSLSQSASIKSQSKSSSKPVEPVSVLRQNDLRPLSKKNEQVPLPEFNEQTNNARRNEPKKDNSHKRPAQRNYTRDHSEPCDEKPRIVNDRISVLKNLSPRNINEDTAPKAKPATVTSNKKALGDDILDSYMEDDHKDMFTLKVKKGDNNLGQSD